MAALLCPYCRCGMQRRRHRPGSIDPHRRTRDHIRPKAWGGSDSADNIRDVCRRCNEQRAVCGHCIGALACARAVACSRHASVASVIRQWRFAVVGNFAMAA
jgi:hypothetical protein